MANSYRLKIVREGIEFEAEGDKKFVLEMLNKLYSGIEGQKIPPVNGTKKNQIINPSSKSLSAGEFIRNAGFKKQVDIVLAFGYYLEKHSGLTAFSPADINRCYYDAKMEVTNSSQFIINLIKKGYIMEAKSDVQKGRKKYTLTASGEKYLESAMENKTKED